MDYFFQNPTKERLARRDNLPGHQIQFAVDDVLVGSEPLPEIAYKEAVALILQDKTRSLESWSQSTSPLVAISPYEVDGHVFLLTVHHAFINHRPLVLSPDMIWLIILQGLATHVNANAEALRHHFVKHDGKVLIRVQHDEFVKGFAGNDWESVFGEFSAALQTHIGMDTHRLLVQEFSTTGIVERAAMEVALMDTLSSFFVFALLSGCGIPSIILEGTTEDWESIRTGAKQLEAYDLDWWIPHLLPFLDQCVLASKGKVDRDYWCGFYKYKGGSGSSYIRGHIVNLFPYLGKKSPDPDQFVKDTKTYLQQTEQDMASEQIEEEIAWLKKRMDRFPLDTLRRNPYLGKTELGKYEGLTTSMVAGTLSSVPFIWHHHNTIYPMEFLAGFVGMSQDAVTLALRPTIGWAVREGVA